MINSFYRFEIYRIFPSWFLLYLRCPYSNNRCRALYLAIKFTDCPNKIREVSGKHSLPLNCFLALLQQALHTSLA